jgi:hypothetical protein
MGTWGDSILDDDDARDIYDHYRRLFAQGKGHAAVRQALERDWADSIADPDDGPLFWFAVARAQWEFGSLQEEVLRRVEAIADAGLGLDRWRSGGPRMLARREKAVRQFLEKIRTPNPGPKARKVEKRHPPRYLPGDCLAVELIDGTFGAAIVLDTDDRHHTEGFDIVALLEWHSAEKPPPAIFDRRPWIRPPEDGRLIPVVRKCYARSHASAKRRLVPVGQVARTGEDARHSGTGFMGRWQDLIADLEHYYGLRT